MFQTVSTATCTNLGSAEVGVRSTSIQLRNLSIGKNAKATQYKKTRINIRNCYTTVIWPFSCVESFGLSISESNLCRKIPEVNAPFSWNWKSWPETNWKNLSKPTSVTIFVANPWITYLNARGKLPTMVTARKHAEVEVRKPKIPKITFMNSKCVPPKRSMTQLLTWYPNTQEHLGISDPKQTKTWIRAVNRQPWFPPESL